MTRRKDPVDAPLEEAVEAPFEPAFEIVSEGAETLLPTTGGAWRIEDGKLVQDEPPTKPAPLPGAQEA